MNPTYYKLPRQITALLRTVGPLHERARDGYLFSISVILRTDNEIAGFLITQQLAERQTPAPAGTGIQFQVPPRPATGSEATHVFADSLDSALNYTNTHTPGSA